MGRAHPAATHRAPARLRVRMIVFEGWILANALAKGQKHQECYRRWQDSIPILCKLERWLDKTGEFWSGTVMSFRQAAF